MSKGENTSSTTSNPPQSSTPQNTLTPPQNTSSTPSNPPSSTPSNPLNNNSVSARGGKANPKKKKAKKGKGKKKWTPFRI